MIEREPALHRGAPRSRWHTRILAALTDLGVAALRDADADELQAAMGSGCLGVAAFYCHLQRIALETLVGVVAESRGLGAGDMPARRGAPRPFGGVVDVDLGRRFRSALLDSGPRPDHADWADLAPEEIGFLYETMRALRPCVDLDEPRRFTLEPGDHRKRSGTYFTPPDLAAALTEWTLRPLMDELGATARGAAPSPVRVCDPAVGGGNVLLAAARILGRRLAEVRTGTREPDAAELRRAKRDVIARGLFGVDSDPLAVELARALLWLEADDPDLPGDALDAHLRVADSLLNFPVFSEVAAAGGFDAVLSNPPFGNAIEARTGRDPEEARAYRRRYPEVARGAYDRSSLFLGLAPRILADRGRYGLLCPRATTSTRGGEGLRSYLDAQAPPRLLWCPDHPTLFGAARVFIAAVVGQVGSMPLAVQVSTDPDPASARFHPVPWPAVPGATWWGLLATPPAAGRGVPLSAVARAWAGCTTATAYALAERVDDRVEGDGPRLVTTGAIDRFRVRWGERPTRFLGRDFRHPRWPRPEDDRIGRARDRQRGAKILVGGLCRVIEAVLDRDGTHAGVVGTLVVAPHRASPDAFARLLAVLNSAAFSASYFRQYGAKELAGGNCTIGKVELLSTPVPSDTLDEPLPDDAPGPPALEPTWLAALPDLPPERARYWDEAARLADALGSAGAAATREIDPQLDTRLHAVVSALYGLTPAEHARVHGWWTEKCGRNGAGAPTHRRLAASSARCNRNLDTLRECDQAGAGTEHRPHLRF